MEKMLLGGMDPRKTPFPEQITFDDVLKCSGKRVALDTETTGLDWWRDHYIGLGIWCPDAGIHGYLPTYEPRERQRLGHILSRWSPETTAILHNAKFDLHFLGINPQENGWKFIDTTVLVHLMDSRNYKSLDKASTKYLGDSSKGTFKHKVPKRKAKKIWEWPVEIIGEYCTNDCRLEYGLAETLIPRIVAQGLWGLFQKDMEYLKLLWRVERQGILLDIEFFEGAVDQLQVNLNSAEQELWNAIGHEFNWRSPQQLSKALYEDMGWPRPKLEADAVNTIQHKKYNSTLTDSTILIEQAKHPLGPLVLHLRETAKAIRTITNPKKQTGYLELMDKNNVIHANFNLTGTRINRLSCSKPNLQNIPALIRRKETKSELDIEGVGLIRTGSYNLRQGFIARDGHQFLSIDWRQMEMRMFAILAQEPKMLEKLASAEDIHSSVSEMVWGVKDKIHRSWAKAAGFGLNYAMSPAGLQLQLGISRDRASTIFMQYHQTFPRIRALLLEHTYKCRRDGYIQYWSGRRWYEGEYHKMYKGVQAAVSGGCAEILSIAALRCNKWLDENKYATHILSIVHDELLFESPIETIPDLIGSLPEVMEVRDLFSIPFFTDTKIGSNYGQLKALGMANE